MKNFLERLARTLGGEKALNIINSSSDIVLALFIIVLIMMIIIPVSPPIIDNLIALNMTISIALLMVALYIPKAVQLSMFPSLLLITTLFRLGIEISATGRFCSMPMQGISSLPSEISSSGVILSSAALSS